MTNDKIYYMDKDFNIVSRDMAVMAKVFPASGAAPYFIFFTGDKI